MSLQLDRTRDSRRPGAWPTSAGGLRQWPADPPAPPAPPAGSRRELRLRERQQERPDHRAHPPAVPAPPALRREQPPGAGRRPAPTGPPQAFAGPRPPAPPRPPQAFPGPRPPAPPRPPQAFAGPRPPAPAGPRPARPDPRPAAGQAPPAPRGRRPSAPGLLPAGRERRLPAPAPRPAAPLRRSRFRTRTLPVLVTIGTVIGIYAGAAAGRWVTGVWTVGVSGPHPLVAAPAAPAAGSGASAASAPESTPASAGAVKPAGAVAAPGTVLVPVYWVSTSSTRSLLAREYLQVPDAGGPLLSAVRTILGQHPLDPDYSSPWRPAGTVAVQSSASGITVDLSADAFAATGIRSETGVAGIQQLIWTLTATAQRDVPVTILVDGASGYQAWNAITLSGPMRRQAAARASVWADTPVQGTPASSPVHVTGQGSAARNAFHWTVSAGPRVVASGTVTGTATGPGWARFAVDVPLPAGDYRLSVRAEPPAGQDMPAGWQWPDTKDFTVG